MGRGHKNCSSCGFSTGPRSFRCPNCQTPFEFKEKGIAQLRKQLENKTEQKVVDFDWRTLQRGERIRVISGSGPYWPASGERQENIPMGYHGKFTVRYVDKDGIHAVGNKKEANGHSFIYMGEPKLSKSGLFKEPHKIVRLKPRKEK